MPNSVRRNVTIASGSVTEGMNSVIVLMAARDEGIAAHSILSYLVHITRSLTSEALNLIIEPTACTHRENWRVILNLNFLILIKMILKFLLVSIYSID